ncbi:protein FAM133 isoform X1 [Macadamia integrifolia]|uniref:protein FAM133 isoform X1 n=1 Tax=Macadamia integrifolia TaxID=60698 RepID=UPI001C4E5EC8|nr:protein FAM133 isoform X1 [Macadamia integrifolia]
MGKNQAYKAMQKARLGSSSAVPEEMEDGMVDGSFHSPEWHAARLASLKTSHTITWDEYKRKQKEDEMRKGELEADKDRMMREYRAQLDAERESKLALGRNRSSIKSNHRKDRKGKDYKRTSNKKRKGTFASTSLQNFSLHQTCYLRSRRSSESSSSTSSSDSSSDDESETKRSKSRSKHNKKKERKHKSRTKRSKSDSEESNGPLPLSRFFGSVKN